MKLESVKQNFDSLWGSVTEGWQHLLQSAGSALTRFKPGQESQMPSRAEVDSRLYRPTFGWSMLGGDVFEDENRLVARVEIPGMDKKDINIEVLGDTLVISGDKRFERESGEGRWRVVQCAYGAFRREILLPTRVVADKAKATYQNGVLRIEFPKAEPSRIKPWSVKVD